MIYVVDDVQTNFGEILIKLLESSLSLGILFEIANKMPAILLHFSVVYKFTYGYSVSLLDWKALGLNYHR